MAVDEHTSAPLDVTSIRWGMGDALAGNLVIVAASVLVVSVVAGIVGADTIDDPSLVVVALLQVPTWLGLLGAPLLATNLKGRRSLIVDFGLRMRWTDIPLGLAVGVAGQYVLGTLVSLLYRAFDVDIDKVGESARRLTDGAQDWVGVVLLVLVVVIAAPVLEELFYRGLWLRAAERRMGEPLALVFTSLLFAFIHFQWYDFPALFGVGLIFGILTVRTGRLGPAIWAHLAFNATTVVNLLVLGGT